jgi:hypothetical protein
LGEHWLWSSEGFGALTIGFDERIDVLSELLDGREGRAVQGFPLQDRKPDLDLVEPGSSCRREVEMDIGVTLQPAIALRLVGIEVVEDDVDRRIGIAGDDIIHEVEEFDASPSILVRDRDFAGGDLKGCSRGAIALLVMVMTSQRPAVGQLQVPLGALQGLDRRLFIDADDDRILRRRHVEPNHIGGLGDELGIVALAPGFATREIDLLPAQEAPDSCTSPNSAAISPPVQRANPVGGSRSSTARMRRPGCGLSANPVKPSRANRPRQPLIVRGMVPSVHTIERVEHPSAASKR